MVPEINPYPAQNGLLEISRRREVSKDKNFLRKVKTKIFRVVMGVGFN